MIGIVVINESFIEVAFLNKPAFQNVHECELSCISVCKLKCELFAIISTMAEVFDNRTMKDTYIKE